MHWLVVGEYYLMLISWTWLALYDDTWNLSVFKYISTDKCFIASRNDTPNVLRDLNMYSHNIASNFLRSWSYLESVGYILFRVKKDNNKIK